MEQIVRQLRAFSSAYLDSLPDGALRRRNALFQEAINQNQYFQTFDGPVVHVMARMGAPVPDGQRYIQPTLGRSTFSPEELLAFLRDNELLRTIVGTSTVCPSQALVQLRRFVETYSRQSNPCDVTRIADPRRLPGQDPRGPRLNEVLQLDHQRPNLVCANLVRCNFDFIRSSVKPVFPCLDD